MRLTEKKYRVYLHLINSVPQAKIARILRVSRQYVSKVVKELVHEGYVEEIRDKNGNSFYPRVYKPTGKPFPMNAEMSTSLTSWVSQPRLNMVAVKFRVSKPPSVNLDVLFGEGHSWSVNNTRFLDYKHVFEGVGRVTFRLINDCVLVVFMPERSVSSGGFRHLRDFLFEKAMDCMRWFCKRFGCVVECLPELYQDFHIAVAESDPFLQDLVNRFGLLKIVDQNGRVVAWYDRSKGFPEFETCDEEIAEIKAFMPVVVRVLEDRVFYIQNELEALEMAVRAFESRISRVVESVSVLAAKVEGLNKSLDRLFSGVVKPDDFRDVA